MAMGTDEGSLYRLGGWAAITLAVAYLLITGLYVVAGQVPSTAEAWLRYLQPQTTIWWAIAGLSVLTDLLFLPVALALYFALRRADRTLAIFGSGLIVLFAVLDLAVTWPNYAALIELAGRSGGAGASADLVAAAAYPATVLGSPVFSVYAILVPALGIFLLSLLMLRGFDRRNGYVGILTGIVGAVAVVGGFFVDELGLLAIFASILTLAWVLLVGVRLLRLSSAT
jgi:hypothetical protein